MLIEFASGQVRHVFRHHGPVRPFLAWRPDGRVLAAASPEAPVYLWDVVGDRTGTAPPWDPATAARHGRPDGGGRRDGPSARSASSGPTRRRRRRSCATHVPADADARLACRACEALELPADDGR